MNRIATASFISLAHVALGILVVPAFMALGSDFVDLAILLFPTALVLQAVLAGVACRRLAAPPRVARVLDVGCLAVAVLWTWQRFVFLRFVPNDFLEYGSLLRKGNEWTRAALLQGPEAIGLVCIAAVAGLALFLCRRHPHRLLIVPILGWWVGVSLLFWWPSFYLSAQGEATVFI